MKRIVYDKDYYRSRVLVNSAGCWLWQGQLQSHGYSTIKRWCEKEQRAKSFIGHREVYRVFVGEIPEGLELDHSCSVYRCVNPTHLEAVTHEENNRRRNVRFIRDNPNFPCGHPRVGDHVFIKKDGWYKSGKRKLKAICRPCTNEYYAKYREKIHASANNLY